MTVVERHPIDTAVARERVSGLAESFESILPDVEDDASWLRTLLNIALMHPGNQCAIDPPADKLETWVAFTHVTQVSSAIFAAATAETERVECLIDQQRVSIPTTGVNTYSNAARWQTALWFATICRDHDRIRALCNVDETTLRTESDNFDDYIYTWIAALQAYFRGEHENVPRLLEETTRLLAPENTTRTHPDLLNQIARPQLLLFLQLVSNDEAGFNEMLRETLEAHRDFWTADSKARTNPVGYIAAAPLAMVTIAHDLDLTIDVESDYLPHHLIRGSWIRGSRSGSQRWKKKLVKDDG